MPNKYVDFVSDEHFLKCVEHVCKGYYESKIDIQELKDNGLDPFKIIFDIINKKVNFDKWVTEEGKRQQDKSLNNRIGEFHQLLLGGTKEWTDLGVGDDSKLDLIKKDYSIAIELKNKFNTVNGDSADKVRDKLEAFVNNNKSSKAYFAYIIEKDNSSGEKTWTKRKRLAEDRIRKIWGASVYELITGDKESLKKTLDILPIAISDYFKGQVKIAEVDLEKIQNFFADAFQLKLSRSRKKKVL